MINLRNPREYIENLLMIRTKEGEEVLLRLRPAQVRLYEAIRTQAAAGKPIRIIVLKARQMGFSTLISALIFHGCATQENRAALLVAHVAEATNNLHQMHRRFYERLPAVLQPLRAASNAIELRFENPTKDGEEKREYPGLRSRIRCATAGGKGVGRSDTLQYVHASEFAFWPDGINTKAETLLGILQAVPATAGTMVFIESTAKGFDEFKRLWDEAVAGRSDFLPVFFPWYEDPDYRRPVPPGTVWTDEELQIREQFGLDEEQLAWRRWCIANNCGGDLQKFHQEYPATPEEAFVASGSCWFETEVVIARLREIEEAEAGRRGRRPLQGADQRRHVGMPPYGAEDMAAVVSGHYGEGRQVAGATRRGSFSYRVVYDESLQHTTLTDIEFVERENGAITIFREPEKGVPYVLGGDTAGEGSDWFGAYVIDNTDCSMCAALHQRLNETEYSYQIYCLGLYYNQALVGLETNFSTFPTNMLAMMGYPKLYVRQTEDSYLHQLKKSYGHVTTRVTRPAMLAEFKSVFESHPDRFCDAALLREMLVFVKNDNGRPAALEGEHDDLVMSMAITLYIRGQQVARRAQEAHEKAQWTPDMWEDWRRATPEQRTMLEAEWGRPW